MMRDRRLLLLVLLTFAAAIAGVVIGRVYVVPVRPVENELHDLLHRDLKLDTAQHSRLETIEKNYAIRRQALEAELRADNARLAEAIEAEHGYGPRVAGAVDRSHQAMGALQKETLEHIFAMRAVLRPDQTDKFDDAVVKALGGRQAAYGELVRRHQGWVHRLVRSHVGNRDEALDVTQASFVAAFAALNRYDAARPFPVWMSRIVINKCHDWRRRRAVRNFFSHALALGEAEHVVDEAPLPDQAIGAEQQLAEAMKAIAALPASLKDTLVLRTIDEKSEAETAEILGISQKAVETRLYRARARLAEMLKKV
jgi:RNA polymerase sigma factor CnrH